MEQVYQGCGHGKIFAIKCAMGGNGTGRHHLCGRKFGEGEPSCSQSVSEYPGPVPNIDAADLVSELGTRGYRLYNTASGLIVRRIQGLKRLGNGRG